MPRILIKLLALSLISASGCSSFFEYPLPNCPRSVPNGWINPDNQVKIHDATFLGSKLYIASSAGLLEIESSRLSRTFKCSSTVPDDFTDATTDWANTQIWVRNLRAGKSLLRFDGSNWYDVGLPPKSEPYTRRDVSVLDMFSTDKQFWLQVTGNVWRWDHNRLSWIDEAFPDVGCPSDWPDLKLASSSCFASIAPLGNKAAFIFHSKFLGTHRDGRLEPDFQKILVPDTVWIRHDDKWMNLISEPIEGLYTRKVVSGQERSYVQTYQDRLFRITPNSIGPIPSLGKIDAMTASTEGNLVVAFFGRGVFEYRDVWIKRFDYPFASIDGHSVKIAEGNGQIALIYAAPIVEGQQNRSSRLWTYANEQLNEIQF